jgi:hypothetical protein
MAWARAVKRRQSADPSTCRIGSRNRFCCPVDGNGIVLPRLRIGNLCAVRIGTNCVQTLAFVRTTRAPVPTYSWSSSRRLARSSRIRLYLSREDKRSWLTGGNGMKPRKCTGRAWSWIKAINKEAHRGRTHHTTRNRRTPKVKECGATYAALSVPP